MDGKKTRRAALRKARIEAARLDSFVADYIKHKNINIYNEAKHLYDMLRNRYPNKLNLKITKEYQCWKDNTEINLTPTQQETLQTQTVPPPPALEQTSTSDEQPHAVLLDQPEFNDTLQLRIPLMDVTNIEKEPTETLEIIAEEVLSEGTIQPSLEEVISDGLELHELHELQADPEINNIFSTLQEQIEFDQLGMDMEIDDENLLEKELPYW